MKIRNGFVSNSSSSSFVVILPENFIETIDFDKITEEHEDLNIDKFKKILKKFIKNECYSRDYDLDEDEEEKKRRGRRRKERKRKKMSSSPPFPHSPQECSSSLPRLRPIAAWARA